MSPRCLAPVATAAALALAGCGGPERPTRATVGPGPGASVPGAAAGIVPAVAGPVPEAEIVFDQPRDAIPALDEPAFVPADMARMRQDEGVVGVALDGDAFAYPYRIMNFHEIVNHRVGGRQVSVTYCPLTNSAAVFAAHRVQFGNSGALYNNNVVMYDRRTLSLWSQMAAAAILGERAGEALELLPVTQSTWSAWHRLHPRTLVLSERTGYPRPYERNTFETSGYTTNGRILFAQAPPIDPRLRPKDMVLGLAIEGVTRAYPYERLAEAGAVDDRLAGTDVVVLYDRDAAMARCFLRRLDGRRLSFAAGEVGADGLARFRDRETTSTWDLTGMARAGPLQGARLMPVATYSAYWFAWASFWQGTEIWGG